MSVWHLPRTCNSTLSLQPVQPPPLALSVHPHTTWPCCERLPPPPPTHTHIGVFIPICLHSHTRGQAAMLATWLQHAAPPGMKDGRGELWRHSTRQLLFLSYSDRLQRGGGSGPGTGGGRRGGTQRGGGSGPGTVGGRGGGHTERWWLRARHWRREGTQRGRSGGGMGEGVGRRQSASRRGVHVRQGGVCIRGQGGVCIRGRVEGA